jgi:hypothetical protein
MVKNGRVDFPHGRIFYFGDQYHAKNDMPTM